MAIKLTICDLELAVALTQQPKMTWRGPSLPQVRNLNGRDGARNSWQTQVGCVVLGLETKQPQRRGAQHSPRPRASRLRGCLEPRERREKPKTHHLRACSRLVAADFFASAQSAVADQPSPRIHPHGEVSLPRVLLSWRSEMTRVRCGEPAPVARGGAGRCRGLVACGDRRRRRGRAVTDCLYGDEDCKRRGVRACRRLR